MDASSASAVLVENVPGACSAIAGALRENGYQVDTVTANTLETEALGIGDDTVFVVDTTGDAKNLDNRLAGLWEFRDTSARPILVLAERGWQAEGCVQLLDHCQYLIRKPVVPENLLSIVRMAIENHRERECLRAEVRARSSAIGTIQTGSFHIRTFQEARNLSTMLSLTCEDPESVAVGLQELMINAIEHGNLEIGFEEKSVLIENGRWNAEIERRLLLEPYRDRFCTVSFDRRATGISISVHDQGPGFDPEPYLVRDRIEGMGFHGRGIFLVKNLYFSDLSYSDGGRCATVHF